MPDKEVVAWTIKIRAFFAVLFGLFKTTMSYLMNLACWLALAIMFAFFALCTYLIVTNQMWVSINIVPL